MSTTAVRVLRIAVAVWLLSSSLASAQIQVAMANGRVTVIAKDATVQQILAEWARVGGVTIVNLERVSGGTMTLELQDMPENDALDVLMRSLGGYIATLRPIVDGNLSRFDRIVVMAASSARAQSGEIQTRSSSNAATAGASQGQTTLIVPPGIPDDPHVPADPTTLPPGVAGVRLGAAPPGASPDAGVTSTASGQPPASSAAVGFVRAGSVPLQTSAPASSSGGNGIAGSAFATTTPGMTVPVPPELLQPGRSPSEAPPDPATGTAAPGMPVPRPSSKAPIPPLPPAAQ